MHKPDTYAIFVFVPGKEWACWSSGHLMEADAKKIAEEVIPKRYPGFTAVDIVLVADAGGPRPTSPIMWKKGYDIPVDDLQD